MGSATNKNVPLAGNPPRDRDFNVYLKQMKQQEMQAMKDRRAAMAQQGQRPPGMGGF